MKAVIIFSLGWEFFKSLILGISETQQRAIANMQTKSS